ncbi:hypothetical protein HQ590_03710 [bacterium]|nr:hypothetical protein [bacterium]
MICWANRAVPDANTLMSENKTNAPSVPGPGPSLQYQPGLESVLRRQAAVWRGERVDPPLIFVDEEDTGVRTVGQRSEWWRDPEGFARQCAERFARRTGVRDDRLPILRPPFSHAILPALLGAEIGDEGGSLWVSGVPCATPAEFLATRFDPDRPLGRVFADYYRRLLAAAAGQYLVGWYEALGPCDLAAAMLGNENWLLLAGAEPDQALTVAQHAARQALAFYRWVGALVQAGQSAYGGTILSQMWAPPDTVYYCDHTALNLGPDRYRQIVLPAERMLTEPFAQAYLSIYPRQAEAVLGPMLAGLDRLRVVYGCAENPSDDLVREYAGRCVFFLRCQTPEEIEHYRRLTDDRGLIIWTFMKDVGEANALIAGLNQ